jgi:phospholipase/lecithinase/hemolysin
MRLIAGNNNQATKSRIREWNLKLADFTSVFRNRHLDASVYIYDVVTLFTEVLDNPKKYGFKDAGSQCPTDECIWNDDLHPTSAMHKVIAADLEKFLFLNSIKCMGH